MLISCGILLVRSVRYRNRNHLLTCKLRSEIGPFRGVAKRASCSSQPITSIKCRNIREKFRRAATILVPSPKLVTQPFLVTMVAFEIGQP